MLKINSAKLKKITDIKKNVLVGYLLSGYKDNPSFFEALKIFNESKFDILELGFPSKNPYADGDVIKEAHSKVNFEEAASLEYLKKIRTSTDKAIWLMSYAEGFITNGLYKIFAKEKVMDALVIPDINLLTRSILRNELKKYGVEVVGFVNPSMDEEQISEVLNSFPIVYEQLYMGKTGVANEKDEYADMLKATLKNKNAKPFAGFGINSTAKIKTLFSQGFYGAIIGTEIIKKINISVEAYEAYLKELGSVL